MATATSTLLVDVGPGVGPLNSAYNSPTVVVDLVYA